MELTRNQKIGIGVTVVVIAFAAGRYSTPTKTVTQIKTVEIEKKVEDKKVDNDHKTHLKRTKTEVDKPDGSKTITTVTENVTEDKTKSDDKTVDNKTKDTTATKTESKGNSQVTISALSGVDVTNGHYVFGASVYKPVLGPIGIGVFGLSDLTFGAQVGITF